MRTLLQQKKIPAIFLISAYGALSAIIQLNYLKTAMFSFSGNELTISILLGHWLIFTATGSFLSSKFHRHIKLVHISIVYSLLSTFFYWIIFLSRRIFNINNFIIIGTEKIFLISLVILAIPVMINGFLFPLVAKSLQKHHNQLIINKIYGAELIGAAFGSFIFSIFLYYTASTYFLLIAANLVFLVNLTRYKANHLSILLTAVIIFATGLFQSQLTQLYYPNYDLKLLRETPTGIITKITLDHSTTILMDNVPIYNSEDFAASEEIVHFYCSAHTQPKHILVLGNFNPLIFREISKYRSVEKITAVSETRSIQNFLWDKGQSSNIKFIHSDPYKVLDNLDQIYDVIILNIPEPTNYKWNRYYSNEFFKQLSLLTNYKSIVGISLPASETFLPKERIDFIKTILNTFEQNFPEITIIPGERIHFLGSKNEIPLKSIIIKPQDNYYINSVTIADRFSDFKLNFLMEQLKKSSTKQINTLFRPKGIYYSTLLYEQQTNSIIAKMYQQLRDINPLFLLVLIPLLLLIFQARKGEKRLYQQMAFFGFFIMSIESLLILLFQTIAGAIYLHTSLIIFMFMLGSGISALIYNKFHISKKWIVLLCNLINLSAIGIIFFNDLIILGYLAILLTGFISGQIFPQLMTQLDHLRSNRRTYHTAKLYGMDIIGGSIGLYLISIFIIPVWGFLAALISIQLLLLSMTINLFFRK